MKRLYVLILIGLLLLVQTGDNKMADGAIYLNPTTGQIEVGGVPTQQAVLPAGDNGFRGYLNQLAQSGDSQAERSLNYVGGDYNGQGDTGINVGELNQWTSGGGGAAEDAAAQAAARQYLLGKYSQFTGGGNSSGVLGSTTGGTAGNSTADTQRYYDDQLSDIDRLLGRVGTAESQGLETLRGSAAENARLIEEQRTKANAGYDSQSLQNSQDKEKGLGQVSNFANTSYKNLPGW
jgi:hypothetical protein